MADGWKGYPARAPFDAIHVGAAAKSLPEELCAQLKNGGIMMIPVGKSSGAQSLLLVNKNADGTLHQRGVLPVRYVPLVPGVKPRES